MIEGLEKDGNKLKVLCWIAKAQMEAGDKTAALKTFEQAISLVDSITLQSDFFAQKSGRAFYNIAIEQFNAGMDKEVVRYSFEKSKTAMRAVTGVRDTLESWDEIIKAQADIKYFDDALNTFNDPLNSKKKVETLYYIADLQSKSGDTAGSGKTLKIAKQLCFRRDRRNVK